MEEALPITITGSASLLARYVKLNGLINKQEAQVNFQTLTAGWYEDETNIANLKIVLVTYDEHLQQIASEGSTDKTEVSDDVTFYTHHKNINCFIAITPSETELLDKEPKILSAYISMKVKKVINTIALQQGLLTLP